MFRFLSSNSEALYGTKPWIHQNDTGNVWYTSRVSSVDLPKNRLFNPQIEGETTIYAWVLDMPTMDLELKNVKTTDETKVTFLGTDVSFKPGSQSTLLIKFDNIPWRHLLRNDVMVLKIENAASQMRVPHKGDHRGKSRTNARKFVDFRWAYDAL
ncbi:unnamed protein product [Strongylus vulgaris]|uniref:Alpha-L-fucosidase C-terminal domain-containing protein n=1 Tax=Strongylus vulgaris TaxID=40348 RepID=A0A3P7J1L8_STRVU|nr:unnamed protein product [Strongylus vulgaris]